MTNQKEVLNYFRNVEIDEIEDPTILQNVFDEIKDHLHEIIFHNELAFKLEILLQKSNYEQKMKFIRKIDFKTVITRKLGSRVVEKTINLLYEIEKDDMLFLRDISKENFICFFIDPNASFVQRKIWYKIKNCNYLCDDDVKDYFDGFKDEVIANLNSILNQECSCITLQYYLKYCVKKQKIIKEIFTNHFNCAVIRSKESYFYQTLLELSNKKNLERFYSQIKHDFDDILFDRYGNYVIQSLIKYDIDNSNLYYELIYKKRDELKANSNVIFNLILVLIDEGELKKANRLIKYFYNTNDTGIFKALLIKGNGEIDAKYAILVKKLFKVEEKYNFDVNSCFRKYFNYDWLVDRNGLALIRAFLEGCIDDESKKKFVEQIAGKLKETIKTSKDSKDCRFLLPYLDFEKHLDIKKKLAKNRKTIRV